MKNIQIGNRVIGDKTYIIAEYGVNHNGSLDRAKEAIVAAAKAGADAIKFQTYTADELVVKGTPKFWDGDHDKGMNQHEAYEAIGGFPYKNYFELVQCCKENNIEFLSTPFSFEAADFLNRLGMAAFKIASSDMSHLPFLRHIAKFGKPVLLSTGASTLPEIREAVDTIVQAGNDQIVIMHCTLAYPTMYKDRNPHYEDANLNIIQTLQNEFPDFDIGISDHTLGEFSSIIAAAKGAKLIEKHYTTDNNLPGSADHWFSVNPTTLGILVQGVRNVEKLSGSKEKKVFPCEAETRKLDKRSIVSKVAIHEGQRVTEDMITYKRPGTGIWPRYVNVVIGRKATKDIPADTVLTWEML